MDPLTYTGAVEFDDGVDRARLLAHLAGALREKNARDIRVLDRCISFRGGIFRWVSKQNVLNAFHRGELSVDDARHDVRYALSIRQLVSSWTSFLVFIASVLIAKSGPVGAIVSMLVAFPSILVVSVAIDLSRFRSFLRKAVDSIPARS
jgi:hypothetical protein